MTLERIDQTNYILDDVMYEGNTARVLISGKIQNYLVSVMEFHIPSNEVQTYVDHVRVGDRVDIIGLITGAFSQSVQSLINGI